MTEMAGTAYAPRIKTITYTPRVDPTAYVPPVQPKVAAPRAKAASPKKTKKTNKRTDSFALFLIQKGFSAIRTSWKNASQTRKAILSTVYALLFLLIIVACLASCSRESVTPSLVFDRSKDGSSIVLNDTTYEPYGTVSADTKMELIGYCEGATDYHVYQLKKYDTGALIVVASIFSESDHYDVYRATDSLKHPRCVTVL